MDVYELLDLTERLLILYGYEVERDVGRGGTHVERADLTKETKEGAPTEKKKAVMYRADILAEKKDMERPFGRIVVAYNRRSEPAQPTDITHLATLMGHANAYMGIFLTTAGISEEAETHASNNNIRIFTPEKIEQLLGKTMVSKPWWQSANAYPAFFTYGEMVEKCRHLFVHWFHRVWEVSKLAYQEFAYMPYWKFSYAIMERASKEEAAKGLDRYDVSTGITAINAHNGMFDTWRDYDPMALQELKGKGYMGSEMYEELMWEPSGTPGKITKPKDFPPGAHFQVYKPALEKWEAKVAATHWISYFFDTDPKNVLITNLELIYFPWWRYRIEDSPFIKNPWREVEWFTFMNSLQITDVFNLYKLTEYRRTIVYLMAEKYLANLLGPRRFTKVMNFFTYRVINQVLFWKLHIRPTYRWIDLFFMTLFMAMVYGMLVFKTGLSLLVFISLLIIFIGPGYAFLYILRSYLQHYPWGGEGGRKYGTPKIHRKVSRQISREEEEEFERIKAIATLEDLYEKGGLTPDQKSRLEKYWKRQAKADLSKLRKGRRKEK